MKGTAMPALIEIRFQDGGVSCPRRTLETSAPPCAGLGTNRPLKSVVTQRTARGNLLFAGQHRGLAQPGVSRTPAQLSGSYQRAARQ
jgi:hypothetical protein